MRILALADEESPFFWDYFTPDRLDGVDLILSCGDLSPHYLSFLATYSHVPILYVHGNHDDCYEKNPPDGCICIDGRLFVYHGLRVLGLGGSMRYKPGKHQFTQREMSRRVWRLSPKIYWRGGVDVLLSHAPAFGLGDGDDLPHTGFKAFSKLLDRWEPSCFVHGHMHLSYGGSAKREQFYKGTRVINAYDHYIFDI